LLIASPALNAQSNRPFWMSSTAVQYLPGEVPRYANDSPAFPMGAVSGDADVISVFAEYLGIPYEIFSSTSTPPSGHPWVIQMSALAATARATGKPLMLQTVLARDRLTAKATDAGGTLRLDGAWAPRCLDFSLPENSYLGPAYTNYVTWMARAFAPRYLVVMVELNLYYVHCGGDTASWRAFVDIQRASYDAVKSVDPLIIAFPSFKLEDLYGQTLDGFDVAGYNGLSRAKRDRLGLATYPFGVRRADGGWVNPYQLPGDYLTRVRTRYPSEPPVVITETGWNTESLAVGYEGVCYSSFIYSAPSFAEAYLGFLIYSAYVGGFDLVSWWSNRDLIPAPVMTQCVTPATPPAFPECVGDVWCVAIHQAQQESPGFSLTWTEVVFKVFGTMGIKSREGALKSGLHSLWKTFQALPRAD
jgi:hypothetical protein